MFDPTCKFLAENFPTDFATWLLGEPIPLTKLSSTELSLEPIRADSLILLTSDPIVLQIEFQTEPDSTMPFRMADYRLRVYRRFPKKQMQQVVIYLTPSRSDLVYQRAFEIPGTRHEFEVIRLWEQPTQIFLESPGLLPLAVLTQTPDPSQTLRQVASCINTIPNQEMQSNIAAASGILAGLTLEKGFINQVLRREIVEQSVIYQEWREEFLQKGRQEGHQEGRQEGRQEGEQLLILRQLTHRFGAVPEDLSDRLSTLSLDQLEALGEALLDFRSLSDLTQWLEQA